MDVGDPPLIGRLLRTESKAYLSGLAATRADPPRETVPLQPGVRPLRRLVRGGAGHAAERAPGRGRPRSPADRGRFDRVPQARDLAHYDRRMPRLWAASLVILVDLPARLDGDRDRQAQLSRMQRRRASPGSIGAQIRARDSATR